MADPIPQIFVGPQNPDQGFGWGGSWPATPSPPPYEGYSGADVAALLQQPPGYTTNPVTGDRVPPPTNPPPGTNPTGPPGPPQPGPPIYTDASGFGSFFGAASIFGSRRYRPSRFSRELEALARRVGLAAVRGAGEAFNYFSRAPVVESASRAIGPYLGVITRGVGRFSGPLLLAESLLEPTGLGDYTPNGGPLSMQQLRDPSYANLIKQQVAYQIAQERDAASRPDQTRSNVQIMVEEPFAIPKTAYPDYRPSATDLLRQVATDFMFGTNTAPFYIGANAPRMPGYLGPLITPRPGKLAPFSLPMDMQGDSADVTSVPGEPASTSSSSSSSSSSPSTPATTAAHTPLGIFKRIPGLPLALGLGGIAASAIVLSGRNRGGGTPAFVAPPITTPSQNVTPATGVQALLVGNFAATGGSSDCGCGPRGPRRKCLERAPVTWRSGRNKGKAAGSKCVRYAQRAS